MKNPVKLLRMGMIWGILVTAVVSAPAQEVGSAIKTSSINLADPPSASAPRTFKPAHKRLQKQPHYLPVNESSQSPRHSSIVSPQSITTLQTLTEPSPSPGWSFEALPDNGEVVPPDTFGAAGHTHLVVACASQLRVMDRVGNVISTRSQELFWSGVGANIFDTRVVYDPYGQRFIMTAAADPGGTDSRLCIAVSSSSNPTTWYRWSEDVDASGPIYADSPTIGFNKTWIVVQVNMFRKDNFEFVRSDVYAYNKANLYANGSGQRTRLTFPATLGGSQVPATMYDPTNAFVYFVENWNGRSTNNPGDPDGYLRIFSLSGGIGSERLNITNSFGQPVFAISDATWAEYATNDMDILPQFGTTNNIYAGDSSIQNVHFRDGLLYVAHTIFLPSTAPTRAAVQWWTLTAGNASVNQLGRIDGGNGGTNMYAYPSIAANRYHDVLVGYSRFSSNHYASAAYSLRASTDPFDEMRGEIVLKAGEDTYTEPIFGQNRWGDWSATTIDPINDVDMWTIQEYAALRQAGQSRWGTWWGRVSPPSDFTLTMSDAPDPVPSGAQITYTILVSNKLEQIMSGVRVTNTLPAGVSYVSATSSRGSCAHSDGIVTCTMGTFDEFATETVTITVTAGLPGSVTNVATVVANGSDIDPGDNTAQAVTDIIASADLQVLGSDNPDPVHVGNNLTYTITITNRGPSAAGGVVLTSSVPASLAINSVTASQGLWTLNGNVVSFTLGVIDNRGSAVITIGCTANAPGMVTNQVRVAANSLDVVPANNTVGIPTRVNARPVITQIGTQIVNEDVTATIPITISDAETAAGSLQLSAASSNQGLIPNANISTGGSGQNRTLMITSAANQFGSNTTTITVTVTDGDGASSTMAFPIDVAAVNDTPSISNIPNPAAINEDTFTSVNFTIGDIDNPVGALILSANSGNTTLVPIQNIMFSPSGSSRTATITPAANRFGTALITIFVSDGSATNSRSFTVTVNPVNDPPSISSIDAQTTDEDVATQALEFSVSDPETASGSLSVTASSSDTTVVPNGNITLTAGTPRTVRVTPAADQNGVTQITLRVSDGTNSQTTTFEVSVRPVNDSPTLAQPANITTNEDAGTIVVALTGVTSGAPNESQTLSVRASTGTPDLVENLQVAYSSPSTTGTLTFNTVANAAGTALIDVVVSDGTPADDVTRQFQVIINGINDPPTVDQIADVPVLEDSGTRSITITGITPGAPNESAQSVVITASSSATAIVPHPQVSYTAGASTATLTFAPAANAFGTATITVTLNDNRPQNPITTETFDITVQPVNDLPTISALGDRAIAEDTSTGLIPFSFDDVEPGPLTVTVFSSQQGVVPDGNLSITGTGASRNLAVTPAADAFGQTLITVRVTDSEGGATDETFFLTVDPVNDPPTLVAIPNPSPINEDAPAQTVMLSGITVGSANESGQALVVTATSSNPSTVPHPTVNYAPPNSTGSLTFAPVANATGSVVITVTVDDGEPSNSQISQTFTVQINPVNDPPTITGDFQDAFTDEDVPFSMNFTIGDVETPVGSLTLRGSSSNLELVEDSGITFSGSGPTRTITVRPLPNASGSVAFISIFLTDGEDAVAEAGFVLVVNEVNDPPTLNPISDINLPRNPPPQVVTLTGISGGDGENDAVTVTATSSNPGFVPQPTVSYTTGDSVGTLHFSVAANMTGSSVITARVSDGVNEITRTFTVTVLATNFPPSISLGFTATNTLEDVPLSVPFTVSDPETYAARLVLTASSTNTTLVPNTNIVIHGSDAQRWITITPAANLFGLTRITITANDGTNTRSAAFSLSVVSSNDSPTLGVLADRALTDNPPNQTINLAGISSGAANESQTLSIRVTSSNPSLVPAPSTVSYTSPNPTGSFVLNPANQGTGSAQISVTVWDNGNPSNSVTRTFMVYIRPSNNAPPTLLGLGNRSTPEDTPITIPFTVNDSVTAPSALVVGATPANPTLVPPEAIILGGSGTDRSINITPAPDRFGSSTITVWVLDSQFGYTASNFVLQVTSVNDRPAIGVIPNQTVSPGANMSPVPFTVSDAETPAQNLVLAANSSNGSLLPASNIIFGGSGTNRSVMAYPVSGETGSATVTVTVTDSTALSTSTSFQFTVGSPEPPTLKIRRVGSSVELLWPTAAGLYNVQGRDQLNSGSWTDITVTPTIDGSNYVVSQPISGPYKFFRLRN